MIRMKKIDNDKDFDEKTKEYWAHTKKLWLGVLALLAVYNN